LTKKKVLPAVKKKIFTAAWMADPNTRIAAERSSGLPRSFQEQE
jgi:hypothetical protein